MDRTAAQHPRTQPSTSPSPRQTVRADAAMATAILLLGIFLAATGGFLVQRWQSGSARRQSLSFEDQLGIVANTAGLIVITWWVMSLAFAVAAALLDRLGRTRAAAATGRFSPAFMRRLVLAAVGLQLLTAPLASAAAAPGGPGPAGPARQRCRHRGHRHPGRPRRRSRKIRQPVPRWIRGGSPLSPIVDAGPRPHATHAPRTHPAPAERSRSGPVIRCGASPRRRWGRSRPTPTSPESGPGCMRGTATPSEPTRTSCGPDRSSSSRRQSSDPPHSGPGHNHGSGQEVPGQAAEPAPPATTASKPSTSHQQRNRHECSHRDPLSRGDPSPARHRPPGCVRHGSTGHAGRRGPAAPARC